MCVCVFHAVVSAAFITMLLQGSAVGVWISLKWTGYRNWSPVEGDLTVSSSELKNRNSTRWLYFRLHNFFQRLSAESNQQFWWAEIRAGSLNYFIRWYFLIRFMIKRIILNCVNCVMLLWTCHKKCLVNRINWMCVIIFTFWVHRRNRRALFCPTTTTFT